MTGVAGGDGVHGRIGGVVLSGGVSCVINEAAVQLMRVVGAD